MGTMLVLLPTMSDLQCDVSIKQNISNSAKGIVPENKLKPGVIKVKT
jgi:hypothetical protein